MVDPTKTPQEAAPRVAEVLGIPFSEVFRQRWRSWFAPPMQPFRTDLLSPEVAAAIPTRQIQATAEWVDTFFMYTGTWTWMNELEFLALRPSHRRALLAIRRRTVRPKLMPVWPSQLDVSRDEILLRWIASGAVRPSQHRTVPPEVWHRAAYLLPKAQELAGTFPSTGSGPNCFGTVMAAFGEPKVADLQVNPQSFNAWMDRHTEPVAGTSHDHDAGTVFVWTEHGQPAHATVALGGGWMLTKPSQSWSSPRLIWTVREAINSWRISGTRLSRYRLHR